MAFGILVIHSACGYKRPLDGIPVGIADGIRF